MPTRPAILTPANPLTLKKLKIIPLCVWLTVTIESHLLMGYILCPAVAFGRFHHFKSAIFRVNYMCVL